MDAPERIWIDENHAIYWVGGAVGKLPEYVRADIAARLTAERDQALAALRDMTAENARLVGRGAEARDYLASTVAMIQHAIGAGKDVFIEPDTKRKLSDARAFLAGEGK